MTLSRVVQSIGRVGSRTLEEEMERRRAQGQQILALRGSPSLPLPTHARDAVTAALDEPDRRSSRGLSELRAAIAATLSHETGFTVDPEREIIVTNGAMQALSIVFRAALDPGDEVIVPSPNFYLDGAIRLAGGVPRYVPSSPRSAWAWNHDAIEGAITGRTRIVYACNPGNPTGFLPRERDIEALVHLAEQHGFLVLVDESYDRFVYDGLALAVALRWRTQSDRLLLVRSLSKSHALAPWRVGYLVAPQSLVDACVKVLEWECLHCAHVPQRVAAAVLSGPQEWLSGITEAYEANRDTVWSAVESSSLLSCLKPHAGPFLFVDVSALEAQAGHPADAYFLERGIPTVPGKAFGIPGFVRLPFGGDVETIARLCELLRSL